MEEMVLEVGKTYETKSKTLYATITQIVNNMVYYQNEYYKGTRNNLICPIPLFKEIYRNRVMNVIEFLVDMIIKDKERDWPVYVPIILNSLEPILLDLCETYFVPRLPVEVRQGITTKEAVVIYFCQEEYCYIVLSMNDKLMYHIIVKNAEVSFELEGVAQT